MNPCYISVPCSRTMFNIYNTASDGERTFEKEMSSQPIKGTSVFPRKWGILSAVQGVWKYKMFCSYLFCSGLTALSDAHFKWEVILETRAATWACCPRGYFLRQKYNILAVTGKDCCLFLCSVPLCILCGSLVL